MAKTFSTSFSGAAVLLACLVVSTLARSESAALPTFAVVDRSTIGGGAGWDFITFDPDGQRLFIARSDRVQVWSAQSRRIVAEIGGTEGVHGVALAPDLKRGFTTNGRSNSVTVFGLDDLHTIETIAIAGRNPDAVLYEPKLKRLYTFNGASHDMTVLNAQSLEVIDTVALGGKPEVGVSDDAGQVYVNVEDTAEIARFDPAADRVTARWHLGSCVEPSGLAIDRAHRRLFTVCANRQMVVIDADSGRLVATAPIGGEPDGVAFDPGLGLAIASNGEGSLTLVREVAPERFSAVATVPTQARARTLSLDPSTHRVYLVTASFGTAPAATAQQPRPRPPVLPDSFSVLVVAPQ